MRGRAWNALNVEDRRNGLWPQTLQEEREDSRHDRRRDLIQREHSQPIALLRFARIRMRPGVDHHIPVRRSSTLVFSVNQHLRGHRRPHPPLHMLPLTLGQTASNRHRHVVDGVFRIELATQARDS
jgi:hypothetical protein